MSRIGSYGATQMYLSRITSIQSRLTTTQIQVSTELKSVNYTGVSADANRMINLENEKARAEEFIKGNSTAETRLKAATVSMQAMEKTMKEFKTRLDQFAQSTTREEADIKQLQTWAFDTMVDMQSYLSANVDGQYIFSGGRVSAEPVSLPAGTLSAFQAIYDGNDIKYPTTRSAHMADFTTDSANTGDLTFDDTTGTISAATAGSLSTVPVGSRITVAGASAGNNQTYTVVANDGTNIDVSRLSSEGPVPGITLSWNNGADTLTDVTTGNVTFTPGADTISATNPGSLAGVTVGTVFTISGSGSGNDGTYEVASNDGTNITIRSTKIATGETVTGATLSTSSWYKGDTLAVEHRVDVDRTVDLGVYASDPAFEKAFRAMGLIAQGQFGTAGGLENNLERVNQARFLMQDAINRNTSGVGPFGTEEVGDVESLQSFTGTTHKMLLTKNEKHKSYSSFIETRLIDMQRVDKTEAVAKLLDDQQALEVSYKTLSSVRELSLLNYMK